MNWTSVKFIQPPNEIFVYTKISDSQGERNFQKMKRKNNLWFCEDGTYVYYIPTHWAYIDTYKTKWNYK